MSGPCKNRLGVVRSGATYAVQALSNSRDARLIDSSVPASHRILSYEAFAYDQLMRLCGTIDTIDFEIGIDNDS